MITFLQVGVKFFIFLLIFVWALQHLCSATALPVIILLLYTVLLAVTIEAETGMTVY